MNPAIVRRGLTVAALSAAAVLAACETGPSKAEIEAARIAAEAEAAAEAARPIPISLNQDVANSASVYLAFTRDMATIRGGFESPEAIQAALERGAAYDPVQISRGLVAYSSILALQSPEFVAGIRSYGKDPAVRQELVNRIVADPGYASTLRGAANAASLIMTTIDGDLKALVDAADSVENDAYAIQERYDARRAWAVAHRADRATRLNEIKSISVRQVSPVAAEAAGLLAAAREGAGLPVRSGQVRQGPYPAAVNNALAVAALAVLGAAGENATATTSALQSEGRSQECLESSKLMLYQCLAASRPSYEDMFCLGRHVVRDLASCARGSSQFPPSIRVSDPITLRTVAPDVTPQRLDLPPLSTSEANRSPAPSSQTRPAPVAPAPAAQTRPQTATERLNTTPGR